MVGLLAGKAFAADIDPASDPHVQPCGDTPVSAYRLARSDEFEGTAVDEGKWNYRTGAKLWSTQLPENNSVADGLFRIHLKKEKVGETEYTGGGIITHKLFRYGYYEATMKVPAGQGWHSSFWMMRDQILEELPEGTIHIELDPVENNSSDLYHFQIDAHRWLPAPHRKFGTKQMHPTSPLTEFHVYGLEFTPNELRYFFDGELISATDASIFEHNDVNVWLTCLAGNLGPKTTGVDDSKLPAETQYGYFRFFEKAPHATIEIVTPDPGSGVGITSIDQGLDLVARIWASEDGLEPEIAWAKVDGPGVVSFDDPASSRTTGRFSQPGQYLLECSATVGSVSNVSQLQVSIDAPIILRLSHKLHGYENPVTDIRESDPDHNNGQDNEIMVGKWAGHRSRGLLAFDLRKLEPGSKLERIELSFWSVEGLGGEVGPIELRELDGTFVEGTCDGWRLPQIGTGASWISRTGTDAWDSPGGDFGDEILSHLDGYDTAVPIRKTLPSTRKFLAAAQKALDSGQPLGLVLVSPESENGPNGMARFASNDSPANQRPVLTLTYRKADRPFAR